VKCNLHCLFFRYGLLGKKFKDTFGHVGGSILGGFVGMKKPENHGVTYSLTEEFTSVYRMHSLLPDNLKLRDISATPGPNKSPPVIKEYDNEISSKLFFFFFFQYITTSILFIKLIRILKIICTP